MFESTFAFHNQKLQKQLRPFDWCLYKRLAFCDNINKQNSFSKMQ